MATKFDITTIPATNGTDAQFRLWASFIRDVFELAGGWTNTTDTGQINLVTVLAPVAGSTSQGYKIYKMADALQATYPVFVKIEFGSGTAAANPGFWITIGTGSDGAGTITGIFVVRFQHTIAGTAAGAPLKCYGSAGTARITLGLWLDAGINNPTWFSLERSVDSSGADNGEGIVLNYGRASNNCTSRFVPFIGGAPAFENGMHAVLTSQNPSSFGVNVGVSLIIPMAGVAKQPPLNLLMFRTGDFIDYSIITVTVYGVSHSYIALAGINNMRNNGFGGLTDTNSKIAMRYE